MRVLCLAGLVCMAAAVCVAEEVKVEAKIVKVIDGCRDLNKNGKVDPYENWKLPVEKRVEDLLSHRAGVVSKQHARRRRVNPTFNESRNRPLGRLCLQSSQAVPQRQVLRASHQPHAALGRGHSVGDPAHRRHGPASDDLSRHQDRWGRSLDGHVGHQRS